MYTKKGWISLQYEKAFKDAMIKELKKDGIKYMNQVPIEKADVDQLVWIYEKTQAKDAMKLYQKVKDLDLYDKATPKCGTGKKAICLVGNGAKRLFYIDITMDIIKLTNKVSKEAPFKVRIFATRTGTDEELQKIKTHFRKFNTYGKWYKVEDEFFEFVKNNFTLVK